MKMTIITLLAVALLALNGGVVLAEQGMSGHMEGHQDHQHGSAAATESLPADVKKYKDCASCGMSRETFSHSRMLVTYADGTTVGVCSIHCVTNEFNKKKGKAVKSVEVGDYNTKALIRAEKAFWVIGGDKPGVMTKTAKWAFAKKSAAEAFIKKNGGKLATYKEALALADKEKF